MKLPRLTQNQIGLSTITLGNLISNVIGGLTWLFLASMMQVDSYGEVNFYVSLATMIAFGALFGMDTLLMTFIGKEKDRKLVHQAFSFTLIASTAGATAIAFFNWQAAILCLGLVYFAMSVGEILGSQRYREYAITVIAERGLRLGLSLLFFALMGPSGILVGFGVSHIALAFRFHQTLRKVSLDFDALRPKFNFAGYSAGWNVLQNIPLFLDKTVIIGLYGLTTLGLYQIGMQFVSMAGMLPISIYQFMLPRRSAGGVTRTLALVGIALSVGMAGIIILASPAVIDVFFPQFIDAITAVQIAGIAIIPITVTAIMNAELQAHEKARHVFIGSLIYIGALLAGVVFLGKLFDLEGLAVGFLLANIIQAGFTTAAARLSRTKG